MTITTIDALSPELVRGRGGGGPASTRTVVAYGFWIFIHSDFTLFSALFAAFAVLSGRTAGGPAGAEVINLTHVFIETMCLLLSSYAAGLGALSAERRQREHFLIFSVFTFALGAAFLYIEISDFIDMVRIVPSGVLGNGKSRSGAFCASACSGTRWTSSGSAC